MKKRGKNIEDNNQDKFNKVCEVLNKKLSEARSSLPDEWINRDVKQFIKVGLMMLKGRIYDESTKESKDYDLLKMFFDMDKMIDVQEKLMFKTLNESQCDIIIKENTEYRYPASYFVGIWYLRDALERAYIECKEIISEDNG